MFQFCQYSEGHNAAIMPVINIFYYDVLTNKFNNITI